MAQSQSQVPLPAFSPPQHSPSPVAQQPGFALPPNKRVRTDGPASQPGSPYAASTFAASPGAVVSPPLNSGSPAFAQPTTPQSSGYNTPYTNGNHPQGLNLPDARAGTSTPPLITPQPQPSMPQYTNAMMAPVQQQPPQQQPQQHQQPQHQQPQHQQPQHQQPQHQQPQHQQPQHQQPQHQQPQHQQPQHQQPQHQQLQQTLQQTLQQQQQLQGVASSAHSPSIMGPPQRPAERPTKDYEYDVTDSLAGTGIDLRAEEQYMSELYSNAMDANSEARTGFAQHPAGSKSTFYGAGPANQPAENVSEQDQRKFALKAAEQAWADSSMRLAVQRTQEINDPFLLVAILHRRAEKIARENHISLNLDMKNNAQSMGKMRLPEQFPTPAVTVKMQPGPDSIMVQTTGSYIPQDSFLVDQLALMSIATKQRLREMVGDANVVAVNRQKTSHGEIPEDWTAAGAPMNAEPLGEAAEVDPSKDVADGTPVASESAPLKRSADDAALGNCTKPAKKLAKITSSMTLTMRELARQEREWEEARLRRRQKRKEGTTDVGSAPSRSGSIANGTPGSIAPESDKPMTKKEMKKHQTLKAAEANSHANQNITSSMFAGLGGKGNLFGKKKSGKTYDWLNAGRGGSGASTPTKSASGTGMKGPNGAPGTPSPASLAMTTEGRNRLGTWREDKEKGKNIQLRDWVVVLERDGREVKALQQAYVHLDASNPR
ncbi:hypothetical protein E4U42_001044 [Claviceps africana]|uniref:Transcription initiation factor TFIID subunit 4 n=1 Tax=Claviceps africana TaxID=83212 RepID=A0A8K0JDL5_9HYPO|nr:hypothetical protein E4U42_001044 [Claviceps africana]